MLANAVRQSEWRGRHPERVRTLSALAHKKRHAVRRAFIDAARADGCVDCGNKNLSVLQSDHVRGEKKFIVSAVSNRPLEALFEELDKCETVCANCHQLRTAIRRNRVA